MSIVPSNINGIMTKGRFLFSAKPVDGVEITDSYNIKIIVPHLFPRDVPLVYELDRKIPRDGKHHINPNDTLCLGSPLRLKFILSNYETLVDFAEKILVPYLYAMSHQHTFGGNLPAHELAHGEEGIVKDYNELLKLKTPEQIKAALGLLGIKKRIANKKLCPCNCGKRYGICKYRFVLEQYRNLASRGWFKYHSKNLGGINNEYI